MKPSTKPKRILYLENGQGYGGAVICMELLLQALNRNCYEPFVSTSYMDAGYQNLKTIAPFIYLPHRFFNKNQLMDRLSIRENGIPKTGILLKGGQQLLSLADYAVNIFPYVLRLIALCRRKQIDLVHLNNEPVCNMGGLIAAKVLGLPVVCHVRGSALSWDTPTARWLYSKVDQFITVADWVKEEVLAMGVPPERVQTIWDGRDLMPFVVNEDRHAIRSELGVAPDEVAVGIFSRLNPWKGHRIFIDAMEKVFTEHPDCRAFIVGGATASLKWYEEELKQDVAKRNLTDRIMFTGQRSDIPRLMKAMDILVHASLEPDPYPGVVLEAMLMGRPIIASNQGGPAEALDDGKTGFLCRPGDTEVLAKKILELVDKPGWRKEIGNAAKKVAWERYAIENHARRIEKVYDKLLSTSTYSIPKTNINKVS
jgi:glycosyltransferase involved in cell wall biosynthesis